MEVEQYYCILNNFHHIGNSVVYINIGLSEIIAVSQLKSLLNFWFFVFCLQIQHDLALKTILFRVTNTVAGL